jgi:fatty acid desaturase
VISEIALSIIENQFMNHREFLQSLSAVQRKQLTEKSDAKGLMRLVQHWGLIMLLVVLIINKAAVWPLLMLPLGVLLVFQFTLLHETIHLTPFKSRWINRVVAHICGYLLVLPVEWFRYFHLEHHRQTHVVGKDPELASPKPQSACDYWVYISGLPLWRATLKTLWMNALGQCVDAYVPKEGYDKVRQEALCMLGFYSLLLAISVFLGTATLLYIWVIPVVIGQPLLRMYLLAEHTGCPHTNNMFSNTRTVYTNSAMRWLAWNMPYHAEHHSYAAVPFHRLADLHEMVDQYLESTNNGYGEFHATYPNKP